MGKFTYTDPKTVALYERLDTPAAVAKYWADYRARRQPSTPQKEERPMLTPTTPLTPLQKRQQVIGQVERLARNLVAKGATVDQAEAIRKVLNDPANRALYKEYQLAPTGALPPLPTRDGFQQEDVPVLTRVKALARELVEDDLYGKYRGMSEDEMIAVVFRDHPSWWKEYRDETSGRGADAPAPRKC
jgi:hypothetical protein